jgi:hypothetical protein
MNVIYIYMIIYWIWNMIWIIYGYIICIYLYFWFYTIIYVYNRFIFGDYCTWMTSMGWVSGDLTSKNRDLITEGFSWRSLFCCKWCNPRSQPKLWWIWWII